jgi:hypothetical protein
MESVDQCRAAPLVGEACRLALEYPPDQEHADAIRREVIALHQPLCDETDDARFLARFTQLGGKIDLYEAQYGDERANIASKRALSCQMLGFQILDLSHRAASSFPPRPLPPEPEIRRAFAALERACAELPKLQKPTKLALNVEVKMREPAALACLALGDARRTGAVEGDPARARPYYDRVCNGEGTRSCGTFVVDDRARTLACCIAAGVDKETDQFFSKAWSSRQEANRAAQHTGRLSEAIAALDARVAEHATGPILEAAGRALALVGDGDEAAAERVHRAMEGVHAPMLASHHFLAGDPTYLANYDQKVPAKNAPSFVRFRAEARAFHLEHARAAAAASQRGAARFHAKAAARFGGDLALANEAEKNLAEALAIAPHIAPLKGPCAFLQLPAPAAGFPLSASLDVATCQRDDRRSTREDPYTYQVSETYQDRGGSAPRQVTRTVKECHEIPTQSCTGKNGWSCYSSGSRQECKDVTRTETVMGQESVTRTRMVPRTGTRTVQHRELTFVISAKVKISAGKLHFELPFQFERKLDQQAWSTPQGSQSWPAEVFEPLERAAASALSIALGGDAGPLAELRAARTREAMERGIAAAKAGREAEAEDAFVTYLRLGGAPTDEVTRWFQDRYGASAALLGELVKG